jgi:hypothetical protein
MLIENPQNIKNIRNLFNIAKKERDLGFRKEIRGLKQSDRE